MKHDFRIISPGTIWMETVSNDDTADTISAIQQHNFWNLNSYPKIIITLFVLGVDFFWIYGIKLLDEIFSLWTVLCFHLRYLIKQRHAADIDRY